MKKGTRTKFATCRCAVAVARCAVAAAVAAEGLSC